MKAVGYWQSRGDQALFIKHSKKGTLTILLVYVDDIIVTGNDEDEKKLLKGNLAREFDIKDLRRLKYFLGIEVAYSNEGIFLSQRKYTVDLLEETGLLGSKATNTPLDPNLKLGPSDNPLVDKGRYQRLVRKLIYLSHTWPDIAFAISLVVKTELAKARNRMKQLANKKRSEREFSIGEEVYLKLSQQHLKALTHQPISNLSPKYYGPFPILERIGTVA
ncbi:uncharacterized mitochondrial protein AtMg00810-like [Diospyros lotus]|uniref:uncharacterized mitochondrial protein AtMg00810-like n=1 Tax=Diospyros lotus TaxID=55363 RepID=UPI00225BF9D2|nr:uncharacterized mitochondrial protein AtMg00810-like [Diospyros lotus]